VFTARYALSPYVKQTRFVFKGLKCTSKIQYKSQFLIPQILGSVPGPKVRYVNWIKITYRPNHTNSCTSFFFVVKGPAADATDALQPWGLLCNPMKMKLMMIIFCPFPSNGAPVKAQGKTEKLGEKPVQVPLRPPQIPHGLTRDRTRASAVGGQRLTAWAMARPVHKLQIKQS
jgi:hypothetical protein